MLDVLVDHLEAGEPLQVIIVNEQPACRWPAVSADWAYNRGCRCRRCVTAHRARAARYREANRQAISARQRAWAARRRRS